MRILMLTTHLNVGGITSYLYTLVKHQQRFGHHVVLVSSGGGRQEDFEILGAETLSLNIRTKSELHPKIYAALKPLRQLIRARQIDIVHAHTRVTQVMGQCLRYRRSIPFCTTCHGFFRPRLSRRLWPCWGQRTIAISPQVADHLRQDFCLTDQQVRVIPNGIDVDDGIFDRKDQQRLRAQHGIPPGPVVGIIARLSDVKGHGVLISALRDVVTVFPSVRLVIVGEGKMEEPLKAQVREMMLQDHVMFFPQVRQPSRMLGLFDVFVMPSLQEGLGLSVMEAQAAGLAVVASAVGGIPSLITDGQTGRLVPPGDPSRLAEVIVEVLTDPAGAAQMGRQAREFIQREFSGAKMARETLTIYEECLGDE